MPSHRSLELQGGKYTERGERNGQSYFSQRYFLEDVRLCIHRLAIGTSQVQSTENCILEAIVSCLFGMAVQGITFLPWPIRMTRRGWCLKSPKLRLKWRDGEEDGRGRLSLEGGSTAATCLQKALHV